ncbi:hypothetical protein CWO84_14790 [Methylomonas sp. Kb3]|uniref:replicative DNA helicase n=1 Tax=Methylomonas sp. Kb3 TaxID=1611544 RepID=UPI000C31ED4B|nr:DnaB-like helicase C-terminal domain-containing protein [Methylomonas sp. Kb3]PKD39567.1 hypothetical protein CWO84_14790 [Methylomonas sp. Kb3]
MSTQTKQDRFEEAVLGIILRSPESAAKNEIDERWFQKWRSVITAIKHITAAGNEPDMLSITEHMKNPALLKELNLIRTDVFSAAQNLPKYLAELQAMYKAAQVQQSLSAALTELQNGGEIDVVVSELMQTTLQAVSADSRNYNATIKQAMGSFIDHLEEAFEARDTGGIGLKTGITKLDSVLGGMHDSDLIIVGARPGVGKTAFGLSALLHLAKSGKRVGFVSTEMAANQVMLRITAANSGIAGHDLRDANLGDQDWPKITTAINRVADLPFRIYDKPNVTVADVALQAKAWAIDGGVDFIVIDYLTRIRPVKPSGNQTNDVGEVVTAMKNIARQLNIPLLVLAQLNRNVTNRADKRPTMADLRDSGIIEQEGDQILLLYRDDDDNAPAEVIVDKNRHGECATVRCCYLPQTMQWVNLAHQYADAA